MQLLLDLLKEQGSTEEYQEALDLIYRLIKCPKDPKYHPFRRFLRRFDGDPPLSLHLCNLLGTPHLRSRGEPNVIGKF